VEAEQITSAPAKSVCLLAPLRQEAAPVLNCLLPTPGLDMIRAASFEGRKDLRER
jgi:hypothetical protein